MGMHFKLGLYEHQSAGALQAIIDALAQSAALSENGGKNIASITIAAYEPAFGIIGNPMKKSPKTRQSADHSMAYIVATLLRKAIEHRTKTGTLPTAGGAHDEAWKSLMLDPYDYQVSDGAIFHPMAREIMDKINFVHGGPDFDAKYPEGIPTSVVITLADGTQLDSGLVMFPAGHARNTTANLEDILDHKFQLLGEIAVGDQAQGLIGKLQSLSSMSSDQLQTIYSDSILERSGYED
jgi:2-methylcitrate dehydratase